MYFTFAKAESQQSRDAELRKVTWFYFGAIVGVVMK
jgi:hypothetical protein